MARRMERAWAAPMFHLTISVDMGSAMARSQRTPGVTVTDVIIRECALALVRHPSLNAHYVGYDEGIIEFGDQNIGVAVATDAGLMVPVIRRAAELTDGQISTRRKDLVERARSGRLGVEDVLDGTFTISNLGMFGIDRFDAIINPPQVAILAVGQIGARVMIEKGKVIAKDVAELTLTCDHRATDGAGGARFLRALRDGLDGTAAGDGTGE